MGLIKTGVLVDVIYFPLSGYKQHILHKDNLHIYTPCLKQQSCSGQDCELYEFAIHLKKPLVYENIW